MYGEVDEFVKLEMFFVLVEVRLGVAAISEISYRPLEICAIVTINLTLEENCEN